jgi:hypothetical protein
VIGVIPVTKNFDINRNYDENNNGEHFFGDLTNVYLSFIP